MKKCGCCKLQLDSLFFYADKSKKDGLSSYCKECVKATRLARYNANKKEEQQKLREHYKNNRKSFKNYTLKALYGINLDTYEEKVKEQNNRCYICNTHQKELKRPLFVDHCHAKGTVRKLLCQHCNTGLGMFKDNPELLVKAADYLKEYNG